MTINDFVRQCYDTIVIYEPIDEDMMEYRDLYKGDKEHIPSELLNKPIRVFGATERGVIEISV